MLLGSITLFRWPIISRSKRDFISEHNKILSLARLSRRRWNKAGIHEAANDEHFYVVNRPDRDWVTHFRYRAVALISITTIRITNRVYGRIPITRYVTFVISTMREIIQGYQGGLPRE